MIAHQRTMLQGSLFVILVLLPWTFSAVPKHSHLHSHNSKERVEDGHQAHHYEGGEHHSEFDHEAILGSHKEAEEFDNLKPEESKRRLGVLVTKMDLNGDQYVDRHELKAWILRSFHMLSQEEAADRLEEIDTDKDRKASWAEYLHDTFGFESMDDAINDQQSSEEEKKLIQDDKKMFELADRDGDWMLDSVEFMMFLSPEEFPEMSPIILEQTLRDKDLDKDGKISFQEFIGDSAKHHDKEWLIVEKEKFDADFDKDKNGVLTGHEILSWVVPSNEDVAVEEVDHLFASSDDDHDDRLSYDEIVNNYEIFVGSEATDYGDHLQNIDSFRDEL